MNPISFFFIEKVNQQQCSIEVDRSVAKGSIDELDSKLLKAERDITTLKAEHIAGNGLLEKMFSDVAALRSQDEDLRARVQRTSDSLAVMHRLMDTVATVLTELHDQNAAARQYTYAPRPSFASDTSLDEPSSHDSASSSRSQSFAGASSPLKASEEADIKVPFNLSPTLMSILTPLEPQNGDVSSKGQKSDVPGGQNADVDSAPTTGFRGQDHEGPQHEDKNCEELPNGDGNHEEPPNGDENREEPPNGDENREEPPNGDADGDADGEEPSDGDTTPQRNDAASAESVSTRHTCVLFPDSHVTRSWLER